MPDPLGDISYTWPFYAAAVIGYLVGSIPFGLVLTKLAGLGDVRKIGSGNIGATNVLRTGNKGLALATLLLDGGKGAIVVILANMFFTQDYAVMAGGGAFLGHLFPVWLKFKGGKGVATFIGVMLAISWPAGLGVALTWLLTALIFRISSLAALVSAALAPVYLYLLQIYSPFGDTYYGDTQRIEFATLMAILIYLRHRQNIARLLKGEEPRIGKKKS
ncbi:glycerol-3-phosphate 1-O-acyltransferase PlsY [Sneathiella chungangensis]|uniref:Glycerol-3-phosphate acyltransferase n=1 Tax=Sneathiella chungangensis TaxID=1418234 RepID=A0A845MCY8_9PROT|nr:glycerol-3-phosphate 1-O-acyltransferase PlsY [Sneathiella chungangensis]MZR21562.1 glycerol-3-phosphate 1-O-acyltransferase PlsY [Sneathiella chungangensis]